MSNDFKCNEKVGSDSGGVGCLILYLEVTGGAALNNGNS